MIYITYIFLLLVLLKLERQQASPNNGFRFIIPILYILIIGLRGANVGVDTPVYYDHYYTFGEWGCDFVEIGFDWLNRLFYHYGFSQAPFFVVCAAFAILPVTISIHKVLSRQEYSIFMLLFCTITFVSMCNGMRQNMACGILFSLLVWFDRSQLNTINKFIIYLLGIFFTSLFHASVILAAPIVAFKYLHLSNRSYFVLYLLSFIFVFVNISSLIPDIQIGGRDYGRYLGGEMTNKAASTLGFIITSFRNLIFLILLLKNKFPIRCPMVTNLAFCMIVFTNLGFNIPIIGRLNMYFNFFYIFMLAKIIDSKKTNNFVNTDLLLIILIAVILTLTIYSFISPDNKLVPYKFYWETPDYSKYLPY